MSRMDEYKRGHRDAVRWTVTWLHRRAKMMNDLSARAALNVAATDLGSEYCRASAAQSPQERAEADRG